MDIPFGRRMDFLLMFVFWNSRIVVDRLRTDFNHIDIHFMVLISKVLFISYMFFVVGYSCICLLVFFVTRG